MELKLRTQASDRAPSVLTVDVGATTRLLPAIAMTLTTRQGGISASAVAVMLWDAPANMMRTVPTWLAGMPTETRPVEPTMSSRLNVLVDSAVRRGGKALEAGQEGVDQVARAGIGTVNGRHLVHDVSERKTELLVGEAHRTTAAVMAE